jgi:hypothetical protein
VIQRERESSHTHIYQYKIENTFTAFHEKLCSSCNNGIVSLARNSYIYNPLDGSRDIIRVEV